MFPSFVSAHHVTPCLSHVLLWWWVFIQFQNHVPGSTFTSLFSLSPHHFI